MKIKIFIPMALISFSLQTFAAGSAERMADTAPNSSSTQVAALNKEQPPKGEVGIASKYWQPQRIACGGGWFNPQAMTAAHKTLPCGTKVKVINLRNGRSVVVTINDRGPYVKGRIIDLSLAAANKIGMGGLAKVRVERVPKNTQTVSN